MKKLFLSLITAFAVMATCYGVYTVTMEDRYTIVNGGTYRTGDPNSQTGYQWSGDPYTFSGDNSFLYEIELTLVTKGKNPPMWAQCSGYVALWNDGVEVFYETLAIDYTGTATITPSARNLYFNRYQLYISTETYQTGESASARVTLKW